MPRDRLTAISSRALTFLPPIGERPELLWVRLASLHVDEAYQRSLATEASVTLVRKIAANWSWKLCQLISVARREDNSLWIVDGQHRHAAAQLRDDIPALPCVIQPYESQGDEAAAFVALNNQRRALSSVDIFKAACVSGDPESLAIMSLISDAGLSLAPHQNYVAWDPGMIYCVPTIRTAYRRFGPSICAKALNALSTAFRGQIVQTAAMMLNGLFVFYSTVGLLPDFDDELFIRRLGMNQQSEWTRKVRTLMIHDCLSQRPAVIQALTTAYERAVNDDL